MRGTTGGFSEILFDKGVYRGGKVQVRTCIYRLIYGGSLVKEKKWEVAIALGY